MGQNREKLELSDVRVNLDRAEFLDVLVAECPDHFARLQERLRRLRAEKRTVVEARRVVGACLAWLRRPEPWIAEAFEQWAVEAVRTRRFAWNPRFDIALLDGVRRHMLDYALSTPSTRTLPPFWPNPYLESKADYLKRAGRLYDVFVRFLTLDGEYTKRDSVLKSPPGAVLRTRRHAEFRKHCRWFVRKVVRREPYRKIAADADREPSALLPGSSGGSDSARPRKIAEVRTVQQAVFRVSRRLGIKLRT